MNPANRSVTPPNRGTQAWDVPQEAVYRLAKLKTRLETTVDLSARNALQQAINEIYTRYPKLAK